MPPGTTGTVRPSLSVDNHCQVVPIQPIEKSKEKAQFDLKTVGFLALKNASITAAIPPWIALFIRSGYP
jgi:hypothetical protein